MICLYLVIVYSVIIVVVVMVAALLYMSELAYLSILLHVAYLVYLVLIVMGDLNIDCSNENTNDSNARIDFIEQITGLRQIVNEPTRVTLTTSTLIDVIFTNDPDRHVVTGVIPLSLSDHYMPFTVINCHKYCTNVHNTISFRDFKRFDEVSFKTDLYNTMPRTLDIIKTNDCDVSESWLLWKESFEKCL